MGIKSKTVLTMSGGLFALIVIAAAATQSFATDDETTSLLPAVQSSKMRLQDAVKIAEEKTNLIAISAELEIEDNRPAYEIDLLTQDGQKMTLMVNALTGELFAASEDDHDDDERNDGDNQTHSANIPEPKPSE